MSVKTVIDSGGEHLIGFARNRLADIRKKREQLGVDFQQAIYQLDSGESVLVRSHLDFDLIRITASLAEFWYLAFPEDHCPCKRFQITTGPRTVEGPPLVGPFSYTNYIYWEDGTFINSWPTTHGLMEIGPGVGLYRGYAYGVVLNAFNPSGENSSIWEGTDHLKIYNVETGDIVVPTTRVLTGTVSMGVIPADVCRPFDPLRVSVPQFNVVAKFVFGSPDEHWWQITFNHFPLDQAGFTEIYAEGRSEATFLGFGQTEFVDYYQGSGKEIWNGSMASGPDPPASFDVVRTPLERFPPWVGAWVHYNALRSGVDEERGRLNDERERARLVTCAENTKTLLREGVIPGHILYQLMRFTSTTSQAVSGLLPDSVTYTHTSSSVEESFSLGKKLTTTCNLTVIFKYTPPGTPSQQKTVIIAGTAVITDLRPQAPYFFGELIYGPVKIRKIEFNNYPAFIEQPGFPTTLPFLLLPPPDVAGASVPYWKTSGEFTDSARFYASNSGTVPSRRVDSFHGPITLTSSSTAPGLWLRVANGAWCAADGAYTRGGNKWYVHPNVSLDHASEIFEADRPQDTVSFTVPLTLQEYYLLAKPIVKTGPPSTYAQWQSTFPADSEIISIIPIAYVHDINGDLGLVPQATDVSPDNLPHISLKIDIVVDFRYSYANGTFTFVRERPLHDEEGKPVDRILIPYFVGATLSGAYIFVSRAAPYPDLVARNAVQAARLSTSPPDPDDPPITLSATEQLLKAVKAIVGGGQ